MPHTPSTALRLLVASLCLAAVAGACGEDNKVGDDKLLTFQEKAAEQQRLGAATTTAPTTTAAPTATSAPGKAAIGAPVATTTTAAPVATTTTARPVATTVTTAPPAATAFAVTINSDNAGTTQFDPSASRVFVNQVVKFTNTDKVARSIEFDNGEFNSGPIAPGGEFLYKATTPGKFNFHDGTRPYAVGSLEVIAR